jgi:D-alanyl-D-alanine dipeptidase
MIKGVTLKLSVSTSIGSMLTIHKFVTAAIWFILSVSALCAQDSRPIEAGKREARLIELITLDKTIKLDIRYATDNNFVGRKVYPEARAFLQKPAAKALVKVHKRLQKEGLGLVIFDGYRPWTITKLFWDVTPEDKRKFVADPAKGSKHNRGCAVDLSIYDLRTGELLDMPSAYDEFTERASPNYPGGTDTQRANREKLRRLMEAVGFTVNPNEWWHFDFKNWENYAIYDISFTEAAKNSR